LSVWSLLCLKLKNSTFYLLQVHHSEPSFAQSKKEILSQQYFEWPKYDSLPHPALHLSRHDGEVRTSL
jgi:hypothetical protein